MTTPYHTALARGHTVDAPPCSHATLPTGSVALVWDMADLLQPIPREYLRCDVVYTEPAWRHGYEAFAERAGGRPKAPWSRYMRRHADLIDAVPAPIILTVGASMLHHLPKPDDGPYPITLNITGHTHVQASIIGYRVTGIDQGTTLRLVCGLAATYDCVGDPNCGYGNTGLIFHQAGKRFVMSDINPTCIGVIASAEWAEWPTA